MKLSDGFQTSPCIKEEQFSSSKYFISQDRKLCIFIFTWKQQQSDQKYSTEILTNIVTSIYQTIMDFYRNHLSF